MKKNNKTAIRLIISILALLLSALALSSCSLLQEEYSQGGGIEAGAERYATLWSPNPTVEFTDSDSVPTFEVTVREYLPYDYIELSYSSTYNVTLADYETDVIQYAGEDQTFPIEFTTVPSFEGISLLCQTTTFEKIIIEMKVYKDNEIVDEFGGLIIYVLATENGVYASCSQKGTCFAKYIKHLYNNGLITEPEKRDALRSIVGPSIVDLGNTEGMTEEEIFEKTMEILRQESLKEQSRPLKTFDNIDEILAEDEIEVGTDDKLSTETEDANETQVEVKSSKSTYASPSSSKVARPTLTITYNIQPLNDGSLLEISGCVSWTDIESNPHPAREIKIEIMDQDDSEDEVLGIVTTGNDGRFSITINNQLDTLEAGCDIFLELNMHNENFRIYSDASDEVEMDDYGYILATDRVYNIKNVAVNSLLKTFDNSLNADAIMIHQALVVGYYYFNLMNNNDSVYANVLFTDEDRSRSETFFAFDVIKLDYCDFFDWDVILHELGHLVTEKLGCWGIFTESHSLRENLIQTYGKSSGIIGAWSEGFANYFSMASQNYYQNYRYDISDVLNTQDNTYSNIRSTFYYFTNSNSISYEDSFDFMSDTTYGEGNESAVAGALLCFLSDAKLTDQELWGLIKNSSCDTFNDLMTYIYSQPNLKSKFSKIGEVLEKYNIVDSPYVEETETILYTHSSPANFKFQIAIIDDVNEYDRISDEHIYNNKFKLTFWDENYNLIYEQSNFVNSVLSSPTSIGVITLSSSEMQMILDMIDTDVFYWSIATYQLYHPSTGPYYSRFIKGVISENLTEVYYLNTDYEVSLAAKGEEWLEFIAPFDCDYLIYSQGDLDTVVELYNSSAVIYEGAFYDTNDDNDYDDNFLTTSGYLQEGEKIYIRVKNSRSISGSCNVVVSPYQSITSLGTVTGDFFGTTGGWYRFVAPMNGYYTFYSSGTSDTFGELFQLPTTDSDYSGRLCYDDDSGADSNFNFSYTVMLNKNEEVYLRIRGYNYSEIGAYSLTFMVTAEALATSGQSINIPANGFTQLQFTAPSAGYYTFYINGNDYAADINVFEYYVTDRDSNSGSIELVDVFDEVHASTACYLSSGQTVYLRVKVTEADHQGSANVYYDTCPMAAYNTETSGVIPADGKTRYMFIAPADGVYTINLESGSESAIWVYYGHPDSEGSYLLMEDFASGSLGSSYGVVECYAGMVCYIELGDGSSGENEYTMLIEDIPELVGCGSIQGYVGDYGDFWFAFTADESCEYFFSDDIGCSIDVYDSVYDENTGSPIDSEDSLVMTAGQTVYIRISSEEYYYDEFDVTVYAEN